MQSLTLPANADAVTHVDRGTMIPGIIGFYFASRTAYTFLFFQDDPALGSFASILIDIALLYVAYVYTSEGKATVSRGYGRIPVVRWLFAYMLFSAVSILWTGAQSVTSAIAYWAGMAADVAIVLVVLRRKDAQHSTDAMMKGAVWGAAAVALVAWMAPLTSELRLGDETLLHPNTLGLEFGVIVLIAQHLASQGRRWAWLGIALAITLLRTVSKTAIIAFLIAEVWYLLRSKRIDGKARFRIVALGAVIVASCWGALMSYFVVYNNNYGAQLETLTGRTVVWATAFSMSLEQPWIGHGFYSFRSLIPAFGVFEPWEAHNELLQHFFEYGAVGIVLVVGIYWSFYRHARKAEESGLRALALATLVFALVHGLTDTVPFGLSYPLWLIVALAISLERPAEVYSA